ncbi:metal ABC transporter substrate-binding protein [Peribacillus psychrosaccharolyticus]|uniref:Metal ABC transporter substrate-binding protein n=1 Tax=Peribacillus psychrosaccharolyticus TaxID=1407 RepID=A0A974S1P3_PERPY|nr:metal ABC transporter substrate-binding protein [Peribacillus psychrosaccharolyticus]MEC2056361.1 metal ABC transporter substrate-binding protein [Peribacillus psychrosaccharolyticus]MED3743763.1 metal ABC transporter substrate-binding protein [Peribacillus psychrosaccharolyticus]QQT00475.1 metal ABC transporter substrate-binding protein [Peribacillus psychrosaccharolyticus]
MKRTMKLLAVCLLFSFVLFACSKKDSEHDKLQVVTTYSILYDIVKEVGGDLVDIHSLAPVGSNPHEYDPLPKDIQKTTDADIVFYNGLNLEAGNSWFEKLIETAGKSGKDGPVFKMSEGVSPMHLTTKGKEKEEDPHAWLDIRNGIKYAENARDGLIKVDPEHKKQYQQNADTYIQKLENLHNEAIDEFNKIPKEKRFLITSEGAFKYFSKAYDFEAGYIWEINSENQGTPEQVTQVVDLINKKQLPVLFVETSLDPRSMEAVSKETGVPIGGKLYTDSIGKPGEEGDTYFKMMKWNIDTLLKNIK